MSRSNPTESVSNPSVRWFEWNGEAGTVRYYDKDLKRNIPVEGPFSFVLLDQLGSVRGWHDASESAIYSNEVKDTRQDTLLVKSFKGGTLAEGFYRDIKDRIHAAGGQFVTNCYIAFKDETGNLAIGSIRFKGAALRVWMEFTKVNRADLYRKGIKIDGFTEGKKGRIIYRTPVFALMPLSETSNAAAVALDEMLQTFLTAYLSRNKREQAAPPDPMPDVPDEPFDTGGQPTAEDIPFAKMPSY